MIDAVEVMYNEEQQVDEGQRAIEESYSWERIRDSLQHLLYEVEDEQKDTARFTGDRNQPEYDKLRSILEHVETYVTGRIEELHPGSYKHSREVFHYAGREEREALQYALQEGINAVALEALPRAEWRNAVEYISEHGLASLNYEAAKKAVIDYCIDKSTREYGVVLDRKEAERIWG